MVSVETISGRAMLDEGHHHRISEPEDRPAREHEQNAVHVRAGTRVPDRGILCGLVRDLAHRAGLGSIRCRRGDDREKHEQAGKDETSHDLCSMKSGCVAARSGGKARSQMVQHPVNDNSGDGDVKPDRKCNSGNAAMLVPLPGQGAIDGRDRQEGQVCSPQLSLS